MFTIEISFKKLIFSVATVQRFLTVAVIGTLCNVFVTTTGWPALINWGLFLTTGFGIIKFRQFGPVPPLALNWWRRVCYWLLLMATLLFFLTMLHRSFLSLGYVAPIHVYRVNLAAILAVMGGVITGGLLYLFQAND
ncbi:hypothetical protein [Lactiplantibacillus carotarum]|uniref:hypothetical protein n=1 Tax=Lactiplantibacillus carotarum TaxID=2993456 RepID=UPI00298F26A5|nr:hypothetical protein [Lactiplantibacillus carotarum]